MTDGRVAFAMVLGPGEMDWNIVLCNESVFIELMSVQFFNHNDWVKTSFHFIENGGGGRVLPLQWFSVVVKWFEIWFLALHPSSSNYWMLIFSPTMIAWKLHFIFYRFGDCFSLCTHSSSHWVRHYYFNLWLQLSLFVPRYSLLIILATATIISLLCIGHPFILFIIPFTVAYMGWNNHFSFPRHMIVLTGYLSQLME